MRLRHKAATPYWDEQHERLVVASPEKQKGNWSAVFGNGNPIHVELGMGKGKFISELSARHSDINFIGVDMYDELIRRAGDKAVETRQSILGAEASCDNLRLLVFNIENIEHVFQTGEIDRIYLNFSDPWPKKRHANRRLTHPDFLRKYRTMMKPGGKIHLKTDSNLLFEFSLNTFSELGMRLQNISLDVHREGTPEGHIFTEYEQKFVEQGQPTYRCEAIL